MLKSLSTKAMFAAGVATVVMSAVSAPAEAFTVGPSTTVSVGGISYRIDSFTGSFNDINTNGNVGGNFLTTQPFFGNVPLAQQLAGAVRDTLGLPNGTGLDEFKVAPLFATQFVVDGIVGSVGFTTAANPNGEVRTGFISGVTDPSNTYATATALPATAVPTPALLPGLIGMGVAALRKRKGEAAEAEA